MRQRRAIDRDAFARQNLRLPVQRQVIGILRYEHVGDERLCRQAAFDEPGNTRACRSRKLCSC